MTWPEYYLDRVNNPQYQVNFYNRYKLFLREIRSILEAAPRRLVVREEGCGIGMVSKSLSTGEYTYWMSDSDEDMLKLCEQNTRGMKHRIITHSDILKPDICIADHIVVTHGVLEHFKDDQIKAAINHWSNDPHVYAQCHYVPTDRYDKPSFGDERLLPANWWIDMLGECHAILDNGGRDLYLFRFNGI